MLETYPPIHSWWHLEVGPFGRIMAKLGYQFDRAGKKGLQLRHCHHQIGSVGAFS